MSGKSLPQFLVHVVDILAASEDSASPCARWSDDGLSFLVLDTKRFSSEFLALHFKSAQFSSFVRQLNFYGFHKLACESKKTWEFKHECFIRGRPDLMHHIKRKTSAEYHSAHKTEVTDLRAKVGQLTGQLGRANAHFAALMDLVKHLLPRDSLAELAVPEHVAEALRVGGVRGVASTGAGNRFHLPAPAGLTEEVGAGAGAGAGTGVARKAGALVISAAAGSPTATQAAVQKRRRVDMESRAGSLAPAAPSAHGAPSPFDEEEEEAAATTFGAEEDEFRAVSAGIVGAEEEAKKARARAAKRAANALAAAAVAAPKAAAPVATRPAGSAPPSVSTAAAPSEAAAAAAALGGLKSPLPGMDDIVNAFNNSLDFTGAGLPTGAPAKALGLGDTIRSASEMDFSWADVAVESPRGDAAGIAGAGAGAGSAPHHRRGSSLKLNGSLGSASMVEFLGSMPALTPNMAATPSTPAALA